MAINLVIRIFAIFKYSYILKPCWGYIWNILNIWIFMWNNLQVKYEKWNGHFFICIYIKKKKRQCRICGDSYYIMLVLYIYIYIYNQYQIC